MGFWKNLWHFIWDDDSIWSWFTNIVLAFVLIKYIVYPGLGFLLNTSFPIVAVISNSMYHADSFDEWWEHSNEWYITQGIKKEQFEDFPMRNGFSKGDIMVLYGVSQGKTKIGDIIVFHSGKPDPIIHRIIKKQEESDHVYYLTKGDNYLTNPAPIQSNDIDETHVPVEAVRGEAVLRIPYLGWVKILAIKTICLFNIACPMEYKTI